MHNPIKSDATQIQDHIDHLQRVDWLDKSRTWWPRFIFHFTNINNAVRILESGKLLSRSGLLSSGDMMTDNASSVVIDQTVEQWKNYVRLYFRPRTPTQNKNEGFRPILQRELNSHCPVPIYFMFDSKKILSREGISFSKGSLAASSASIYSDAASFKEIPFRHVYHDSWFEPHERSTIIHHRHAEVVVPNELDLHDLKHIWCRSEAEYHTLLHLLSPETNKKWKDKIGGGQKGNLFFRSWIFVEKVDLNKDSITINFNIPSKTLDPIHIKVLINEHWTGSEFVWENENYVVSDRLELRLAKLSRSEIFDVKIFFDDQMMYSNEYNAQDLELPF